MNRMLFVPAIGCLGSFAVLLLVFHAAAGREAATRATRLKGNDLVVARSAVSSTPDAATPSAGSGSLSGDAAEQQLQRLSEEYLRPWRQWENSPHRLYSRVAPRPIPSISAEVAVAPPADSEESFVLGTITIRTGDKSEPVACIVDRVTKKVHLFSSGKWLGSDEWLKKAPTPRKLAMRD